jgi:hypothetical protein
MAVIQAFGCVATFRIRPGGSLAALGGAGEEGSIRILS